MASGKSTLYVIAVLLLCTLHAATGSNADDRSTATHAVRVDTNDDETASIPDFDGDGTIGFGDFVIFAGVFGASQGEEKYDPTYDLNGDGEIGFADFVIFAEVFGSDASSFVSIPDANLRAAIEAALGKASGAPITVAEIKRLTALNAWEAGISELTGLETATNLTDLSLGLNRITDLSALSNLTNLTSLNLWGNIVSDISVLSGLTNLTVLQLGFNPVTDLSPLGGLANLTTLGLFYCHTADISVLSKLTNLKRLTAGGDPAPIVDISPLAGLTYLTYLWLSRNDITDISPLTGLTNLTFLQLALNDIMDITPLSGLSHLTELYLGRNLVADISPLAGLNDLTALGLYDNPIIDVSPLAGLTRLERLELGGDELANPSTLASLLSGLTGLRRLGLRTLNIADASMLSGLINLTELNLSDNTIMDISVLSRLNELTELDLSDNTITDISPLAGLTDLTELYLSRNIIADISPLAGLTNLTKLYLSRNTIAEISPLASLNELTELDLSDNTITNISPLSGLTNLTRLYLGNNNITDISPLEGLARMIELTLRFNAISDISALTGLTNLKWLWLRGNLLNDASINDYIPVLQSRGTDVKFDPPRPEGDFNIELVFTDAFSENQKKVLQYVARRWMAVIQDDLPDYELTRGWSGQCGGQAYEIPPGERIDDLRIYMTTFEGDGAVGWGGPRLLRDETHLPVVGCMGFDLKRANLLITGLHEIGHVLGFGTVWAELGFYQNPRGGDEHFSGPLAIAAFDDAGGRGYTGKKVPLDDPAHWRVPELSGELMVPHGGGSLSAITVQSMADLGYGVDVAQADPYMMPGAASKAVAKITVSGPVGPAYDTNVVRTDVYTLFGGNPHGQGPIEGRLPLGPADGRTGFQESAEHVWGRGLTLDLAENRRMWDAGSTARAAPELTCGAELLNEPIYVVDTQGRIVRTISP